MWANHLVWTTFVYVFAPTFSESQDAHLRWKNDKEKILHPETLETKAEDQKNKADALAKEEESLGNDSSLAHQSFIRTRFKQSEESFIDIVFFNS